jgi:ADP-ribosyl-[dinitrogen reductase] hydrolase
MISKTHHLISLQGSMLGTAVGDAIGLPSEGISRRRAAAMWPDLRHSLIFGRGMLSDDTEHTLMLAVALLENGEDTEAFQRSFAQKLRWWMLALPAGVGLSTAKAIFRLWLGISVKRAGVRSAGNGAAMRSAIIGVVFADDAAKRKDFALAACRVTHTDPRAEESALLVAEAAALAAKHALTEVILIELEKWISSDEMKSRFDVLKKSLTANTSVPEYAAEIGCGNGVSGFAPNTVAVAIFAWLRHRENYEEAIRSVIVCGGDTDSVAAITGGICGAELGERGIPAAWLDGICDWPRSVSYIRKLAAALAERSQSPPGLFWPAILLRNLVFLIIVLFHGLRRLLPPY